MGAENNLGCCSSYTVYLALETESLTGLDLTKWAKLAGQRAPGSSSVLGLQACAMAPGFFMWTLEIQTQALRFV